MPSDYLSRGEASSAVRCCETALAVSGKFIIPHYMKIFKYFRFIQKIAQNACPPLPQALDKLRLLLYNIVKSIYYIIYRNLSDFI